MRIPLVLLAVGAAACGRGLYADPGVIGDGGVAADGATAPIDGAVPGDAIASIERMTSIDAVASLDSAPDGGGGGLPETTTWKACGAMGASWPRAVAGSPDGKSLVVGYGDGSISVLPVDGSGGGSSDQHNDFTTTTAVAYAPDGALYASLDLDAVNVWSRGGEGFNDTKMAPHDGRTLRFAPVHAAGAPYLLLAAGEPSRPGGAEVANIQILRVVLSSDAPAITSAGQLHGSPVAAFTADGTAVWQLEAGNVLRTVGFDERELGRVAVGPLTAPVFSSDSRRLAGLDGGGDILVYGVGQAQPPLRVHPGAGLPERLVFLGGSPRLLALGPGGAAVHSLVDGSVVKTFHPGRLLAVDPSPDGATFAAVDDQGRLRRLTGDGDELTAPVGSPGESMDFDWLAPSPDGKYLGASAHTAVIWDMDRRAIVDVFGSAQIAFSPGSDRVALSGTSCSVSPLGGGTTASLPSASCDADLIFAPGSGLVAVSDHGLEILDDDGKTIVQRPTAERFPNIAYSPDGAWLASSSRELWSTADWTQRWSQPHDPVDPMASAFDSQGNVSFSADGTRVLLSTSRANTMTAEWTTGTTLYDVPGGQALRTFDGSFTRRPALSPDGAWIAGGRLVQHLASGTVRMLDRGVLVSRFLSDGRIVAGSQPGNVVTIYCPSRE